jgi:signal transduction histidine kinase
MLTQDLLELYAEQWLGVVEGAGANGCDLICFCGRALEAPGFRKQANAIYDLVTTAALDGLIVWSSVVGINVGRQRLEEFCRRFDPLPMISLEEPLGTAPIVLTDNRRGMYAAVSHLIEVHGRRRIAFVRGPALHPGAQERHRGYLDALADHGLVADPGLTSDHPSSWIPDEAAAFVAGMLRQAEPPDAVAAANDDFAVAAISALTAAGVRTPQDVAVVGFDDFTNIRNHDLGFDSGDGDETGAVRRTVNISVGALALTTVRSPFRQMGRRAVELLLALLRGEAVPDIVTVPTELVVRRSCGCLPTDSHPAPATEPVADPVTAGHAAQLGPALTRRPAGLPVDWPQLLSSAFAGELRGESPGMFPRQLDQLVQVSLRSGESVENWWRVLFLLRQLIDLPTADGAQLRRAEDIWLEAQMLLTETVERHWRYQQVLTEKRDQIVREVGQRLITTADAPALAEILADELAKVGIPGCYLASYEPPYQPGMPGRSRLLLAYENGSHIEVPAEEAVFDSVRLVPGDRLRRAPPYSIVAAPLYFNDQQLGFVLFEIGPRIGWIYAALQEQLSSALHRVFLVERERMALAAVAEAHRREERHRLAGELHDSVSQALFSMTLHTRAIQLAMQQQGLDPDSRVARGLAELRDLTQGALTEMRALIFQLRPDALHEEGLVAAIRRHAAAVAAREGFEICVHAPQERLPLTERAEEELFRIVQEALHNAVKHARPRQVDIRMQPAEPAGTLLVEVADDGVGFDPDISRPGHLGLDSMYERTLRLGGQFTVDSSPAGSTTVRAVLPQILRQPTTGGG